MKNFYQNKKGVALLLVLCCVIFFIALAASLFSTSLADSASVRRQMDNLQAFYNASAGAEYAYYELAHTRTWCTHVANMAQDGLLEQDSSCTPTVHPYLAGYTKITADGDYAAQDDRFVVRAYFDPSNLRDKIILAQGISPRGTSTSLLGVKMAMRSMYEYYMLDLDGSVVLGQGVHEIGGGRIYSYGDVNFDHGTVLNDVGQLSTSGSFRYGHMPYMPPLFDATGTWPTDAQGRTLARMSDDYCDAFDWQGTNCYDPDEVLTWAEIYGIGPDFNLNENPWKTGNCTGIDEDHPEQCLFDENAPSPEEKYYVTDKFYGLFNGHVVGDRLSAVAKNIAGTYSDQPETLYGTADWEAGAGWHMVYAEDDRVSTDAYMLCNASMDAGEECMTEGYTFHAATKIRPSGADPADPPIEVPNRLFDETYEWGRYGSLDPNRNTNPGAYYEFDDGPAKFVFPPPDYVSPYGGDCPADLCEQTSVLDTGLQEDAFRGWLATNHLEGVLQDANNGAPSSISVPEIDLAGLKNTAQTQGIFIENLYDHDTWNPEVHYRDPSVFGDNNGNYKVFIGGEELPEPVDGAIVVDGLKLFEWDYAWNGYSRKAMKFVKAYPDNLRKAMNDGAITDLQANDDGIIMYSDWSLALVDGKRIFENGLAAITPGDMMIAGQFNLKEEEHTDICNEPDECQYAPATSIVGRQTYWVSDQFDNEGFRRGKEYTGLPYPHDKPPDWEYLDGPQGPAYLQSLGYNDPNPEVNIDNYIDDQLAANAYKMQNGVDTDQNFYISLVSTDVSNPNYNLENWRDGTWVARNRQGAFLDLPESYFDFPDAYDFGDPDNQTFGRCSACPPPANEQGACAGCTPGLCNTSETLTCPPNCDGCPDSRVNSGSDYRASSSVSVKSYETDYMNGNLPPGEISGSYYVVWMPLPFDDAHWKYHAVALQGAEFPPAP